MNDLAALLLFQDDMYGTIGALGAWFIIALLIFVIWFVVSEYIGWLKWKVTPAFKWQCKLISSKYMESTEDTAVGVGPAIGGGGGVSVVAVPTGDPEKFITIWDCGKYGRLVVDDEKLFQQAKKEMTLWLKVKNGLTRYNGWER